jgi:transmembrane sensor
MNTMNSQIYEEASEWIILHRSGDLDTEAKQRFDAWVRESPQHLKAYLEMSTLWDDVPTLNRDWNPSANELIARAREDSNVFPLDVDKVPPSTVPGSGGFGVIGTVPNLSEGLPLETPKDLEAQEVLDALKLPEQESTIRAELARASAEPALRAVPVTVPASQSMLMKLLAIAATLILSVGITGWFYLQRNAYTTDIGEQRTIALTDGSSVELNAQTKIRIAYTDNQRTIQLLRGQALFKVAKDPQRPFIVDTKTTQIRAVGTQFDVYKKSTGIQVTVVEGRVAVAAPVPLSKVPGSAVSGQSPRTRESGEAPGHSGTVLNSIPGEVLLSAGQQILIAEGAERPELSLPLASDAETFPASSPSAATAPALTPQSANVEAATAWTQQRLVFDFTPLTEVAEEFNRYNRRALIIEDATLSDFNISGSFSSTNPTLLLRFLRDQPGIVVHETTDEIRIWREDTHG